jgi:phage terminase large subunit
MVIKKELLPKQMQFIKNQSRFLVYSGSVGAGKSQSICLKLAMRASVPGAREILARKTFASLRYSTLKTLIEGDGGVPPILPLGSYTHNKSEKRIKIKGGGEILYLGLDDPEKIGSINASGIAVDEITELTWKDWVQLKARIRSPHPMGNQIYGATNPYLPTHWVAKEWGLALDYKAQPDHESIQTRTDDNFFLDSKYVESIRSLTGTDYQRFFLGQWVGSDAQVFPMFDRSKHVFFVSDQPKEFKKILIGVDDGFTDPFAVVVIGIDSLDRHWIISEIYQSEMVSTEKVECVERLASKYSCPIEIQVDSAAPDLIASIQEKKIAPTSGAKKGPNSITQGISLITDMMSKDIEGVPQLRISENCLKTIAEFESYERQKDRHGNILEDPIDKNNHTIDAVRYALRRDPKPKFFMAG